MAGDGQIQNMTNRERLWGGVLLAAYLWALPLCADPAFALAERLLGAALEEGVRDAAYHYVLFALTAAVFWGYLGRTTRLFRSNLLRTVGAAFSGLAAFFLLSELAWRLTGRFFQAENLNDLAIAGKLAESPRSMVLIVVVLAPFVEEVLFRGYLFGNIREVSRPAAYLVSCLAFALLHVWQFAAAGRDPAYLLPAVQYVVPGLVLAWTYERSGTLWGSVLVHSIVNGISAARLL
ncbi:MAG: CPBP family intramembrane metalloprotease [Oscillospiraceae bacterium]|nr:CPBP family intramembrane metalloprotease [Oscillospiraceae bacterium]